jgi:inosose dehydratase
MIQLAGAPISWGVCEVPDWGYQLAPNRVLAEMRATGLSATEIGPEGFLPSDPVALAATLSSYDLTAVGGFAPVLLHDAHHDPMPVISGFLDGFVAAHAEVLVLAAVTGADGYDSRPGLDHAGWKTLLANLDRLHAAAAERGIRAVIHPHVGTMVERRDDVNRVLEGSIIPLCLDTGHLLIGGVNPLELAQAAPERITHAHLKDVNAALASRVQTGDLTYTEAVAHGMYTPLGTGDADIKGVVSHLVDHGFDGWFVLEQDTILAEEPKDEGPVRDVAASAAYLRSILAPAHSAYCAGRQPEQRV